MRRWRIDGAALRLAAALLLGAMVLAPSARSEPRAVAEGRFLPQGSRVGDYFQGEVAAGHIPGAVVLIERHGKPVYFEAFGFRDPLARTPMTKDAIFRIYSMSNPITSVAVMMLVDGGKIALNDPR